MADELIDIYDELNNFTGKKLMKSEAHKTGLWHRAIHLIVYNSKGDILLQKRASDKLVYPDLWDISAAGHISSGETAENTVVREAFEEIGLNVLSENLEFVSILKINVLTDKVNNNEFAYVFLLKFDGEVSDLKFIDGEVQEIKFISLKELEKEVINNYSIFCPHGNYWLDIVNAVKKRI